MSTCLSRRFLANEAVIVVIVIIIILMLTEYSE